jgi:23S rRNA (uracil1939-C5)-methyltransferase
MEVTITKLVHGGQGMATMDDGRKVFVWGALPGETVRIRIIKGKRSYAEAITEEVVMASPIRLEPRESNYLATSPWQIIPIQDENGYKKQIIDELFMQAHVALPDYHMTTAGHDWQYRNKMEYSFWGDEQGLHLALHNRGSHAKSIVQGSELALPAIDAAARAILPMLRAIPGLRAGDLKTVIIRCDQQGNAVAALFVKPTEFPLLPLPVGVQGLRVYHSNPKSPASVPTTLLHEVGNIQLQDAVLGNTLRYDVDSFFQVNIPVFEQALSRIRDHVQATDIVDMYAGVGSIGLTVASEAVDLVELDPASAAMARINARESTVMATVIESSTEKVLGYIDGKKPVIFDPPRAGLHDKVIARTLEMLPEQVAYLSCNPATQARDLALLASAYDVSYFEAFNFFPHTPHIETLAILSRR